MQDIFQVLRGGIFCRCFLFNYDELVKSRPALSYLSAWIQFFQLVAEFLDSSRTRSGIYRSDNFLRNHQYYPNCNKEPVLLKFADYQATNFSVLKRDPHALVLHVFKDLNCYEIMNLSYYPYSIKAGTYRVDGSEKSNVSDVTITEKGAPSHPVF